MNRALRAVLVKPVSAAALPGGSSSPPAAAGPVAPALLPLGQAEELGPTARRALAGGVLAAHLLGGWALLQVDAVRQAVVEAAPIMVSLIQPAEPLRPAPPPPPAPQPLKPRPAPAPVIAAAPTPSPAPPSFTAPAPEPVPAPVAVQTPAPPAPVAPPAPPAPKQVPASALRYLVEPRTSVPLLSRRLGESGVVVLRVVVDARGQLKEASIKKSSGFARLDQQALQDIRSARFVPQTENGQPIEVESSAAFSYELN